MKRILIVGAGDVAQRAMPWLCRRFRVYALIRRPEAAAALRALGVVPILGDLDQLHSLRRIAGIADAVIHTAPPHESDVGDARSRKLMAALNTPRGPRKTTKACGKSLARRLVYISTSGVYGDCAGELVSEARPLRPRSARAQRRVAAESLLREAAIRSAWLLSILRAPGIYAAERFSLARLQRGDPVLQRDDDVITNHIHADDLARACVLALFRGRGGRAFNVCDDAQLPMGDYFDAMADIFGLPRPPRASRAECAARLSPMMMSFMRESRRLDNRRVKRELRLRLTYPDVLDGLRAIRAQLNPDS